MPNHLFFDLDHTIWDFEANAEETLIELYDLHKMYNHSSQSPVQFIEIYKRINDELWAKYRNNLVSKEELRTSRFELCFMEMGYPKTHIPNNLWLQYIQICPTKTRLIEGAKETLDYLAANYNLHLITNGFSETQRRKLKHSKLDKYFNSLTISEEVGSKKPDSKIFEHALKNSGSILPKGVYVGDNIEADVIGGLNLDWQVFWYNPQRNKFSGMKNPNLQSIEKLTELKKHF